MLICNGTLEIACANCGHVRNIDGSELIFEVVETDEREMGPETTWEAQYDYHCEGIECGEEINVSYTAWEYPSGTKSHEEALVDNGKVISKPNISFELD